MFSLPKKDRINMNEQAERRMTRASVFVGAGDHGADRVKGKAARLEEPHLPRALLARSGSAPELPAPDFARALELGGARGFRRLVGQVLIKASRAQRRTCAKARERGIRRSARRRGVSDATHRRAGPRDRPRAANAPGASSRARRGCARAARAAAGPARASWARAASAA